MNPFLPTTCLRDQVSSTRSTGRNFLPRGAKEYSTRTGISVNICRFTSPSRSSSRNCCVKTFCEMRGMLRRRVLKRSGFLDSKSHQRITGFQRPPINTSSCSIGHMLAINLALISAPVTRYPFGAWYLLNDIRQWIIYRHKGNATRGAEHLKALGIVNVVQPAAKKNCITGAPGTSKPRAQELDRGIHNTKLDKPVPLRSFEFGRSCGSFAIAPGPEILKGHGGRGAERLQRVRILWHTTRMPGTNAGRLNRVCASTSAQLSAKYK